GLPPLTERQERKVLPPSVITHGTMDSWDFSLTMSPTASLTRRPGYLRGASLVGTGLDSGEVFDFDVDEEVHANQEARRADEKPVSLGGDSQMQTHGDEPLLTQEIAFSVSSQSSTTHSYTVQSPTNAKDGDSELSRPGVGPSSELPSQPVPVPKRVSSHNSAQPNSDPAVSQPVKLSPPSIQPATSAPSLWRKLTGGPIQGAAKDGASAKSMKDFLSRKASEANDILGKSKTKPVGRLHE
ncbi:hypothetical protein HWV62_8525, partial [Athelia sp. TMB]